MKFAVRMWRLALASLVSSFVMLAPAAADESALVSPRMAKGLIVKLKSHESSTRRSLVRLQAASKTTESSNALRLRLSAVAQRRHVGFLMQKQTAFAAHVIHSGKLVSYAEAQADAERLRADPDVEWVVVNEVAKPASVVIANDPGYSSQTWLQPRETTVGGRKGVGNIETAWGLIANRSLSPVVVAVLDTGILPAPDLQGRTLQGYDFVSEVDYSGDGTGLDSDPSDPGIDLGRVPANLQSGCTVSGIQWHGLSVAAVLAAATGNTADGAGVLAPLPGPVLLPVRVGGMCGAAVSDIIEGMLWAAGVDYQGAPARNSNPARVINISFGGDGSCADSGMHDAAWLYRQTVQTLENAGALVVASAGNGDSHLGLNAPTRPANCPGVLAVTALNEQGYKARYANLVDGTQLTGLAVAGGDPDASYQPDNGIFTLTNHTEIVNNLASPSSIYEMAYVAGTSFSAPTAAGVAALMLAVDPSLTVSQLRSALVQQIEPFPTAGFGSLPQCQAGVNGQGNCVCTAQTCGAGVLDAGRAVTWAIAHADAQQGGAQAAGNATSASASACYFTPERLGGANRCQATSSGGSGGGGAMDVWSLIALAVIGMCALRTSCRARRPGI